MIMVMYIIMMMYIHNSVSGNMSDSFGFYNSEAKIRAQNSKTVSSLSNPRCIGFSLFKIQLYWTCLGKLNRRQIRGSIIIIDSFSFIFNSDRFYIVCDCLNVI